MQEGEEQNIAHNAIVFRDMYLHSAGYRLVQLASRN